MGTRSAFASREPVRITVEGDSEQWIDIKPMLNVGDRNGLYDVLLKMEAFGGSRELVSIVKFGAYLQALGEAYIVDWSLKGEDGQPVPFDRKLIATLDPDDPLVDKVFTEVLQRSPFAHLKRSGSIS